MTDDNQASSLVPPMTVDSYVIACRARDRLASEVVLVKAERDALAAEVARLRAGLERIADLASIGQTRTVAELARSLLATPAETVSTE